MGKVSVKGKKHKPKNQKHNNKQKENVPKQKSKPVPKGLEEIKSKPVSKELEELKTAVYSLGGDEEDLQLLQGIDQAATKKNSKKDKIADQEEDLSAQARRELEEYIKSLGLDSKFKGSFVVPDDQVEEVDDVSSDEFDDEDEDEAEEEAEEHPEEPSTSKTKSKHSSKIQVEEISSTTPDTTEVTGAKDANVEENDQPSATPDFHFLKDKASRQHCIVKYGEKWYDILPIQAEEDEDATPKTSPYWIPKLAKYAQAALDQEVENYRTVNQNRRGGSGSGSEMSYIGTVLKSGSLTDKISAHSVLLQGSPVHNLHSLEYLIDMVSLKSRRPCMLALDALRELFVSFLLAPDRKLCEFKDRPFSKLRVLSGGNKDTRDRYLIIWLFEEKLKELYHKFFRALDEISKDTIENTKVKAMSVYLELLVANPELEQELLERLVNKLGDPVRSIAAKAIYQLGKLLETHPAMKLVVLKEVERLLFRPNVNPKAQYYGICFLCQMILRDEEEDDAVLANKLIQIYFGFFKACVKKGDIDSKLMGALLTGVNRAFPYAKMSKDKLEEQTDIMFRVSHLSSFNISLHALMLIYQIMDSGDSTSDRFYTALYKKLLDPSFGASSKQALFLNLVYKSMKKDPLPNRTRAFIKRLLQMCNFLPPQLVCSCLFLVSEVIKARPELGSMRKVLESAKLLGESVAKFDLKRASDDDDEEEHYEDFKEEGESKEKVSGEKSSSWVHRKNLDGGKIHRKVADYDPNHRNPAFCGAENSQLYELRFLASHFHPSVALFAQNLIDDVRTKYSGDPLQDFAFMKFLDRFVFRNPKKDPFKGKVNTVMAKRDTYVPKGAKALAPDSKEYVNRNESAIPEDEMFIYRYFKEKKDRFSGDQDSDAESVTSEDFNDFMDRFAGKGQDNPDVDVDFASNLNSEGLDSEDEDDDPFRVGDSDGDEVDSDEPELEGDDDGADLDFEDFSKADDSDDEFDEEGFEISDEDEDEVPKASSKRKAEHVDFAPPKKKGKNKDILKSIRGEGLSNLLASADEFADMIEDAAVHDLDVGGSESLSNKDRASTKQLKWEQKRHDKFSGRRGFKQSKGKHPAKGNIAKKSSKRK